MTKQVVYIQTLLQISDSRKNKIRNLPSIYSFCNLQEGAIGKRLDGKILRMGQSYIPVNQFRVSQTYQIFKNILQDFFFQKSY